MTLQSKIVWYAAVVNWFSILCYYSLFHPSIPYFSDTISYKVGAWLCYNEPSQLYNFDKQFEAQKAMLGEHQFSRFNLPYLNPPYVAVLMGWMNSMPMYHAFYVWMLFNGLLIAMAVVLARRLQDNSFVIPMFLSSYPLWKMLVCGNMTLVLCVAILSMIYVDNKAIRGLALAITAWKPHLSILLYLVFISRRDWLTVLWSLFFVGVMVLGSVGVVGVGTFLQYPEHIANFSQADSFPTYKVIYCNVYGFMNWVFGINVVNAYVTSGLLLISAGYLCVFAQRNSLKRAVGLSVLFSLVFSRHGFIYDYVLLVVPLLSVWTGAFCWYSVSGLLFRAVSNFAEMERYFVRVTVVFALYMIYEIVRARDEYVVDSTGGPVIEAA